MNIAVVNRASTKLQLPDGQWDPRGVIAGIVHNWAYSEGVGSARRLQFNMDWPAGVVLDVVITPKGGGLQAVSIHQRTPGFLQPHHGYSVGYAQPPRPNWPPVNIVLVEGASEAPSPAKLTLAVGMFGRGDSISIEPVP